MTFRTYTSEKRYFRATAQSVLKINEFLVFLETGGS